MPSQSNKEMHTKNWIAKLQCNMLLINCEISLWGQCGDDRLYQITHNKVK